MVPPERTKADQSCAGIVPSAPCPVTKCTERATSRCVRGTCKLAAAAQAAVTPGTTVTGTPAARREASSSPPRPNTNGSPPFSRTTWAPDRASRTISALIAACCIACRPQRLPTSMRRTSGRAKSRIDGSIRASNNSTSALWIAFTARNVSRSGSPGPQPTSVARPSGRGHADIAQDLLEFGDAGAAIRAGPEHDADFRARAQPVGHDGMPDRIPRDTEAGADARPLGGGLVIEFPRQQPAPRGIRDRCAQYGDQRGFGRQRGGIMGQEQGPRDGAVQQGGDPDDAAFRIGHLQPLGPVGGGDQGFRVAAQVIGQWEQAGEAIQMAFGQRNANPVAEIGQGTDERAARAPQ